MTKKLSPQLLLFDLDGTLLDSAKKISPRNLKAIGECRDRGILIGVATVRSEITCQRYTDQLAPDLLISNSGALVRLRGKVIYQYCFTADEAAAIVRAGLAEDRGITVDCEDTTYSNRFIPFFNEPGITRTDFRDFSRPSFKICVEGTDADFAIRTAALVEDCSWLAFTSEDWFKFSKKGVSKGDAIRHLAAKTDVAPENIICFGDDNVDIEMFEICGVGVAMENAVEEVREQADFVIGSNDTDAIADYLYTYIL